MNNYLEETIMLEESLNNILIENVGSKENKIVLFIKRMIGWFTEIKNKIIKFTNDIITKVKEKYNKLVKRIRIKMGKDTEFKKTNVKIPKNTDWGDEVREYLGELLKINGDSGDSVINEIKEIEKNADSIIESGKELKDYEINSFSDLLSIKSNLFAFEGTIGRIEQATSFAISRCNNSIAMSKAFERSVHKNSDGNLSDKNKREIEYHQSCIRNSAEIIRVTNTIATKALSLLSSQTTIYGNILQKYNTENN